MKKIANKSTQVDSPPGIKTISLSDSETTNTKVKQLPPNDYFRFPKSKASSSPVISMNTPTLPNGNNNSSKRVSHTFLSAIDKDTFKRTGTTPEHPNSGHNLEKPIKNSIEPSAVPGFPSHNQRSNYSMSSRYISTGSMLTEEMLLNGNLSRLRYMNPQSMHLLSEPNAWTTSHMSNADIFLSSPSRTKNFIPTVTHHKRR